MSFLTISWALGLTALVLLIGVLAGLPASAVRAPAAASGGRPAPDQPGSPAGRLPVAVHRLPATDYG